jgi:hypothetical protein
VGWALSLSEELQAAGIPHRIQAEASDAYDHRPRRPDSLPYGVFVLAEHAEAAARIDRAHSEQQLPDLPADLGRAEFREDQCPACGASVAASAETCPDCGLALLVAE